MSLMDFFFGDGSSTGMTGVTSAYAPMSVQSEHKMLHLQNSAHSHMHHRAMKKESSTEQSKTTMDVHEHHDNKNKPKEKCNHTYLDHLDEMPPELREFINERYNEKFIMSSIDIELDNDWNVNNTGNGTSIFDNRPHWQVVLDKVVTYIMTFNVVGIMLGMGCAIYWRDVTANLWPPIGIIIGMCGQFILLPATAFGFSILFKLKPYEALGCLVVSSSPGGAFSNFFTYWVDGDVALSVVMTACSSIIAFGMMPFNLWLYSSYYIGDEAANLIIPYLSIFRALGFICGPVIIGMIIRHFTEKWARVITRVTSIIGYMGFVTVLTSWMLLYWQIFMEATKLIYAGAVILPVTGFTAAYTVAFLFRRSHKVCRTIGIETGSQNMPVALSIILLSFDEPEVRAKMILFPTLYGVFMLCEVFLGILFYRMVKLCMSRHKKAKELSGIHTAQIENGFPHEKQRLR